MAMEYGDGNLGNMVANVICDIMRYYAICDMRYYAICDIMRYAILCDMRYATWGWRWCGGWWGYIVRDGDGSICDMGMAMVMVMVGGWEVTSSNDDVNVNKVMHSTTSTDMNTNPAKC
eukprot:313737-Amorphochlora_amoeboformis.AAC.1